MIMGRMTQLNRVPFMSRLGRQLTGVSGSFVGEGAPKPVGKQTFDNVTLGFAKVAVIVVLSDEAVRFSTIKAEMRARDDMVKGIATYIDKRFIDPNYSGVANVSPASITNGATRYQSSGTTLAAIDNDVLRAFAMFASSDVDPSTAVWVMPATRGAAPVDEAHHAGREGVPRALDARRHVLRPAGDRLERDGRQRLAERAADRPGDAERGAAGRRRRHRDRHVERGVGADERRAVGRCPVAGQPLAEQPRRHPRRALHQLGRSAPTTSASR
jgi:hypothetical protein